MGLDGSVNGTFQSCGWNPPNSAPGLQKNAKADPAVLFSLLPGVGNISVTRGPADPTGSRTQLCVIVCLVCVRVCERETEIKKVCVCAFFLRTAAEPGPYRLRKFVANRSIAVTVCTVWSSEQR